MRKIKKQVAGCIKKETPFSQKSVEKSLLPFPVKEKWIILLILGAFLFVSLFLVRDYGMNIDSQKNFLEGEMNLNYLLTC